MVTRHRPRASVETLDFVTSVGHREAATRARMFGYAGAAGPTAVITDLGVLRPDPETKELTLTALHPGATVEEIAALRELIERSAASRSGTAR